MVRVMLIAIRLDARAGANTACPDSPVLGKMVHGRACPILTVNRFWVRCRCLRGSHSSNVILRHRVRGSLTSRQTVRPSFIKVVRNIGAKRFVYWKVDWHRCQEIVEYRIIDVSEPRISRVGIIHRHGLIGVSAKRVRRVNGECELIRSYPAYGDSYAYIVRGLALPYACYLDRGGGTG